MVGETASETDRISDNYKIDRLTESYHSIKTDEEMIHCLVFPQIFAAILSVKKQYR